MPKRSPLPRSLAPLVVGLFASLFVPAQAFGRALIRFVHAVPGVGTATVDVNAGHGTTAIGSIGFGQVTAWRSIRSGSFRWALIGAGKTLVKGHATVGMGAYDIVVLDKVSGVALGIYKAEGGKPGTSLMRVIHAAPELGSPELTLDSKPAVNSLSFTQATPYLSVKPGMHSLGAMKPGNNTPLVSGGRVHLRPGVAYSAIVIGSRGQRVRVVDVIDRGAPLTRATHHRTGSRSGSRANGSPSTVVVKPGDSLWRIAESVLPAGASNADIERRVVQIWDRNAERIGTGDPNLIFPGQRLLV
jgi:nucleoid-associated protein YgaU